MSFFNISVFSEKTLIAMKFPALANIKIVDNLILLNSNKNGDCRHYTKWTLLIDTDDQN